MTYFCPVCWAEVAAEQMICGRCGADLRAWEGQGYVEKLITALRHPEPTTPLRAAWLLGRLRAREAVPPLMELARSSPDLFLREAAVEALGRIGDPRSLELLRALARSESVLVRRAARRALAMIEGSQPGGDPATDEGSGRG